MEATLERSREADSPSASHSDYGSIEEKEPEKSQSSGSLGSSEIKVLTKQVQCKSLPFPQRQCTRKKWDKQATRSVSLGSIWHSKDYKEEESSRMRTFKLRKSLQETQTQLKQLKVQAKWEKEDAVRRALVNRQEEIHKQKTGTTTRMERLQSQIKRLRLEKEDLEKQLQVERQAAKETLASLIKERQKRQQESKALLESAKQDSVRETRELRRMQEIIKIKEEEIGEKEKLIYKLESEKMYLGEEIFRLTGIEEAFWSDETPARASVSERERCLIRKNSTLNTQVSLLEKTCCKLTSENHVLKRKMDVTVERPLRERSKEQGRQKELVQLRRRNQELQNMTKRLEEKVKSLEKKTKESSTGEKTRSTLTSKYRERDADYLRQLQQRDREIQRLKERLKEVSLKMTGRNGEKTLEQGSLELENIIRLATKERMQLERHLAIASEGLQRHADIDVNKLVALEERNRALRAQLLELDQLIEAHNQVKQEVQLRQQQCDQLNTRLKLKHQLCDDLEVQLVRVIEKNTELTIENSDLHRQVLDLQQISSECQALHASLGHAESECETARSEVTSLQVKLSTLESVLKQFREAAEERRDLERQHADAVQELRNKQHEYQLQNPGDRAKSLDAIESLQSKIRELEKKTELQVVRHEELVLEMASMKRAGLRGQLLQAVAAAAENPPNSGCVSNNTVLAAPAVKSINQDTQTSPNNHLQTSGCYENPNRPSSSSRCDIDALIESELAAAGITLNTPSSRQIHQPSVPPHAIPSSATPISVPPLIVSHPLPSTASQTVPQVIPEQPVSSVAPTMPHSILHSLPHSTAYSLPQSLHHIPSSSSSSSSIMTSASSSTTSCSTVTTSAAGNVTAAPRAPPHSRSSLDRSASEIDRIMARIDHDNRILAELEKTRSTIGTSGGSSSSSSSSLMTPSLTTTAPVGGVTSAVGGTPILLDSSVLGGATSVTLPSGMNAIYTALPNNSNVPTITVNDAAVVTPAMDLIHPTQPVIQTLHGQGLLLPNTPTILANPYDKDPHGHQMVNGGLVTNILDPTNITNKIDMLDIPGKGRCHVFIAKFSYDPFQQSPNENPEAELAINAGDYILVWGEMDEDGFFDGELMDGRRGLVPSNFTEKLVGEDLLEFHQSVVMGLRDSDESVSTSVPQDLDFNSSDEAHLIAEEMRRGGEFGFLDLDDVLEEDEEDHLGITHPGEGPDLFLSVLVPPPKQLTLERQLNKSILIGWNPPDVAEGTIETYHVYVDGVLKTIVKASERTRALVEGVDSLRPHRISVRSVTPNRRTSRDAACTMVIGKDVPLAPSLVRATHVTSTSAVISWLPSNSNFQHTVCVNNVEVRTVKPGVYRHTITGLTPNTVYRVTVRAKNINKAVSLLEAEKNSKKLEMLSSHVEFRTLPKGLPDAPVDVQVEPGPQDGTLLVTWLPVTINNSGTSNGAPVTGYSVYADGKKIVDVESPTGDHALIDLLKLQVLNPKHVTVRTKSRDGHSADSHPGNIPHHLLHGRKFEHGPDSVGDRSELSDIAEEPEEEEEEEEAYNSIYQDESESEGGMMEDDKRRMSDRVVRWGYDRVMTSSRHHPAHKRTDLHSQQVIETEDLSDKEIYPHPQTHMTIPQIEITKDSASEGRASEISEDDYEHLKMRGGRGGPHRDPYSRGHPHHQQHQDPRRPPPNMHERDRRDPRDREREMRQREMGRDRTHNAYYDREGSGVGPRDGYRERDREREREAAYRSAGGDFGGRRREGSRGSSQGQQVGGKDDRTRIFVALFDYDPPNMSPNPDACDEELPFREGQLIKIFGDKDADGFFWGEASGRRGYVPCNMVSEVQVDDERAAQEILKEEGGRGGRGGGGPQGRESRRHQGDRWGDIYANMPVKKMVALYDYDPQELSPNVDAEVELSFRTGEIIYVYGDMDEDGFFMGEIHGVRGLVPSNFLTDAPQDYRGSDRLERPDRGERSEGRGGPPPPRDHQELDRRKGSERGSSGPERRPSRQERW